MGMEDTEVGGGGFLGGLPPKTRIAIIAGAAAFVLIIILILLLRPSGKPEDKFVLLYKQLSPASAGKTAEALKELRIPFEVREGGSAIAVDKKFVDEARIQLALKGLPETGIAGFELFDKGNFLSTDFEKKITLQRAINGELSRLVKRFSGVEDARVNIVVPEPQLFQDEQLPTTASVLIQFSPGGGFTEDNVEAITHLVASSVPGLKPENVTVVDTSGVMLATGQGASGEATKVKEFNKKMEQQIKEKRKMEQDLEIKAVDMLEKVIGAGRAKVRVTLDVNFNETQTRKREYKPILDSDKKPLSIAKKATTEKTETKPGTTAPASAPQAGEAPTYAGQTGGGNSSTVDRTNIQETYNFDQIETLETQSTGTITRRSIAVFYQPGKIEEKAAGEEEAEEGATKKAVITKEQVEKIVKAATGFVEGKDIIHVEEVKFDTTAMDTLKEEMIKEEKRRKMVPWWVAVIVGIGALAVGAGISGALLGKKKAAGAEGAIPGVPGAGFEAIPAATGGAPTPAAPAAPAAAPATTPVASAPVTALPPDNPFGFLHGVKPETVAQLLSAERLPTLVAVLAQLDPVQAEDIINLLTPEIQNEVRSRLATNPVLPPMTQKMVSQSLKKRLSAMLSGTPS